MYIFHVCSITRRLPILKRKLEFFVILQRKWNSKRCGCQGIWMNRSNKISGENFRSLVHLIKSNNRIISLKVKHIISYELYHKGYENAKSELPL